MARAQPATENVKTLSGKVALVTGGGGGIGRETVKLLLEHGARVVVADLSEEAGRETLEYVDGGDDAIFVATDVTDLASVEALVARTVERFGALDVAHNNAGVELPATELADISPEQFHRVIAVNLTGVFYCMQLEVAQMLRQGGGSIINTSSGLGEVGQSGYSPYVASKHAVIGLTKTGAIEYSSRGIRVNAILPGVIMTPMVARVESESPGFIKLIEQVHPIGRLGTPRDVAEAVVWLGSDASSFVTGVSLPVDGGFLTQ